MSQSLIKDIMKTKSIDERIIMLPAHCPQYIKHKYVDRLKTKQSDAMLLGSYFEWHLLGAVRDGIEPKLPRINIRDQRPTKSASKNSMVEYIMEKAPNTIINGTGKRIDLKPAISSSKPKLIEYMASKSVLIPERATKEELYEIIKGMPEDLGEPEITNEDLFTFIQTLPPDYTEGDISTQQKIMDLVIENARKILLKYNLDVDEGEKQVRLETEKENGHLDWRYKDIENPERIAIYDVKFTKTRYDDWRNGWFNVEEKEDAKIQALHYIYLHYENTGEFVPFYFLVFGESGWIRIFKFEITEDSFMLHKVLIQQSHEWYKELEKSKFKAKPEYNRCLECDFNDVCKFRAVLPEIEKIRI